MGELTLLEWAVAYIKYKDSVRGKIQGFGVNEKLNRIDITNRDGSKEVFLCYDLLSGLDVKKLTDEKIACLNKKDNLNWLIGNWDAVKDKKCAFLFVNPKKSENWAINPSMHSSVTDKAALKPGLKSLFESIGEAD
jgi:hypothetical protein